MIEPGDGRPGRKGAKLSSEAIMEEDEKSAVIGGDWYYVASTNRLESIGPGIMHESSKTKRH